MGVWGFVDGDFIRVEELGINVKDLGLQRAYGVFEYFRTYNRRPFRIADHLSRFRNSASRLNLEVPLSDSQIAEVVDELIRRSDTLISPALRLILTAGDSEFAFKSGSERFVALAEELPTYPKELYQTGVKLTLVEFQREIPAIKHLNYLNAIRLEPYRVKQDAFDLLYFTNSEVLESPRSNVLFFFGDTLVAPANNVLHGITRKVVLELAREHFSIEERPVKLTELSQADEAIITSTTKPIFAITRIDDIVIGDGRPGPRTKLLMERFQAYVQSQH